MASVTPPPKEKGKGRRKGRDSPHPRRVNFSEEVKEVKRGDTLVGGGEDHRKQTAGELPERKEKEGGDAAERASVKLVPADPLIRKRSGAGVMPDRSISPARKVNLKGQAPWRSKKKQ